MFEWLFGKNSRDNDLTVNLMRAAAEGHNLSKLRQAVATVTARELTGSPTEMAAKASSYLATSLVKSANMSISDDDDIFVVGTFCFAFADHFSRVIAGQFEQSAALAVMDAIGIEHFNRSFPAITTTFNELAGSGTKLLMAVGQGSATWMQTPSPENYMRLVDLYKVARNSVKER